MKKVFAALLGLLGFAWWRKRAEAPPPGSQPVPQPDPAEELRARLAEQREAEAAEPHAEAGAETGPETGPELPEQNVASRRSDVHDRARRAMDDLSTPEE